MSLDFDLQVDGTITDLTILHSAARLFLIDICKDLLFLLFILIGSFLLSLSQLGLLIAYLSLSLIKLDTFVLENSSTFSQSCLFLLYVGLALSKLPFLLS